jgi:hypothetical protein
MAHGMNDETKQVVERLEVLKETVSRLRGEVEALTPAIKEADPSPETAAHITGFLDTGRKLTNHARAIADGVRSRALKDGDYSFLARQLAELRDTNLRYQEAFDSLWKTTLPVHLKATLQDVGKTEAELWQDRWGVAGPKAFEMVAESDDGSSRWALVPDQERALLTLRYAGLSLNDVSRLLAVSPPLILNRQADLEVDIAVRLLHDWLVSQDAPADTQLPADRITIESLDLRTLIRRTTSPQPMQRHIRYMRLLNVQIAGVKERWLLRVVLADEEMNGRLDAPELTAKHTPNKIVMYRMGHDEFRFFPYETETHPTLKQIEQAGSESHRDLVTVG